MRQRKLTLNADPHLQTYVIGLAIGDGNLSNPNGRAVRLRIACDTKFPALILGVEELQARRFRFCPADSPRQAPAARHLQQIPAIVFRSVAEVTCRELVFQVGLRALLQPLDDGGVPELRALRLEYPVPLFRKHQQLRLHALPLQGRVKLE
jgi:hypothetical protein